MIKNFRILLICLCLIMVGTQAISQYRNRIGGGADVLFITAKQFQEGSPGIGPYLEARFFISQKVDIGILIGVY